VAKSQVAPMSECAFLGFTIKGKKIRWTYKALADFKHRIKELTGRSWGVSMEYRLRMKLAIQHGCSSNSNWQMSRTPVINQAISNPWLQEQGLLSVKDLWCKAQGYTEKKGKGFVERADLLNRPLRTRTVGGVGATVRSRCLPD
jgi:hypothetical protein